MTPTPTISVLMPVYNAERYLEEAVQSILSQTFGDFQFIIVDDGSADRSLDMLRRHAAQDSRIRVISRPNTGIVGALNDGLAVASGEFIARMDADDVSLPERFAVQVDHLRKQPECHAVGCMALAIDEDGAPLTPWILPVSHEEIDESNLRGDQTLIHSALVVRRSAIAAVGGYRPERETCEDLDLFLRLAERGRLANIAEILLKVRRHSSSIIHSRRAEVIRINDLTVNDARHRRGLAQVVQRPTAEAPLHSVADHHRSWAWSALRSGNISTARKHAIRAFRQSPLETESWRVVYCALRGY